MISVKSISTMMAAFFAAIFISGFPAQSQPVIDETLFPTPLQSLLIDLDHDGTKDRLSIYPLNRSFQVLSYETGYGAGEFDASQAFIVPINLADVDSLHHGANPKRNSFTLSWGCFACGRSHSEYKLTIRLEGEDLQVIGYDQLVVDRIHAASLSCSVNLLTGKAILELEDVERIETKTPEPAHSLQTHQWDQAPKACEGLDKYDDAFLAKHLGR